MKWSELTKAEKEKVVDGLLNGIKEKIVNHATGFSISIDREKPEVRNGLGQIIIVKPETVRESITIDINYI